MFQTAKNFWATLFIRASASCSKILFDKNTCSNTVKNIRATLFSRASACKLLKNSVCKSIFHTAKHFGTTLFFRASAICSKILNDKKYFNTVKNSRANPDFQRKRKLLKNPEYKKYTVSTVNSGHPLFFRASACKLLKIPECKKYIQYSEKFQDYPVFQGKHKVAQKS